MTHFFPHLLRSILPGFFCLIFSQQVLTANTHPADSLKRFSDSLLIDRTPLCTDPTGVAAFWIDSQKILRVVWTDFSAASNYTRYRLRYKLTSVSPYVYSMVYSGRGIDRDLSGVTTTKPVNIALQKICDGTMDHWTLESGWVEVTATDINMDSTDFCGLLQEAVATNNTSNVEINVDVKSTKPSLPSGLNYGYRVKKCSDGSWVGPYTFTGESCTVPTGYISPSNACAVELNIYNGATAMCNPLEITLDDPKNIEPCSGSNPGASGEYLTTLPVSTVVFVNGIPVTVAEVTGSSGEYFTGSGMAIIPVKSATLAVNFNSIRVDAKTKLVTAGTFTGINSLTRSIPTVAPVTATICIPPPPADSLGLDENGFGPDGSYGVDPPYEGYAPPMDFDPGRDPRGFDVNGYHVHTGTKYDEFGCDQQGRDSLGQHCDSSIYNRPYYWINPDETEDGQAFVIEYGGDIKRLIIDYLDDLYDRYADSVSAQTTLCSGFRTTINSNLTTLGLDDPTLVKGTADVYVADGMSKKFVSEPVPLANSSPDRNAAAVTMEQAHVDLYHCDKKLELLKHIKTWADNFRTTDSTEIYEYIFGILKIKSKEELDTFIANVNKLNLFIEQSANNLINSKVLNDVGSVEEKTLDVESAKKVFEDLFDKKYKTRVHGGVCSVESYRKGLIPAGARAIPADLAGHFYFSPPDAACQPLEIVGESGGIVNTLLITNVRMSPGSCLFDVYMVMRVPSSGKDILFKALDVGFNGAGPTAGSLGLGSDVEIRMTNAMKLILKEGTAVNFDCHGFKDVTVVAEIAVCREYLTPLDENNKPKPDSVLVKGYIDQITIKNWSNFFADISFDKFCVTDYPQYNFQVTNAEFDFSDFQSPSNVAVPAGYASPFYSNGSFAPSWRGVYISEIQVGYSSGSDSTATTINVEAHNMIFDGMGFSGDLMVAVNQASLENNLMGGWPMSIDTIQMGFVANHLVSGGLSGQIVMSIACKDSSDNDLQKNALRYKAAIAKGGNYLFSITANKELEVGLWVAKMRLKRIQVIAERVNDEFTFAATLDGSMRVGALDSTSTGKSFGATFTNLMVSNKAPYLYAGTWNFDTASVGFSFKGFGLKLYNPGIYSPEPGRVNIGINAAIELVGDKLDIAAGARVLFKGKMIHPEGGRQRWVIDKIGVDSISIDADINDCAKVKGVLIFADNDPVYGDGFYGFAQLTIKKFDFIVNSAAQFGKKTDIDGTYKYFFVDAFVKLPPEAAIPIMGMDLRGLGGGLFYNMVRVNAPTVLATTENPAVGFGMSLSGVQYVPAKGHMEFKAAVLLTAKSNEEHLSINAELAFAFRIGDGISLEKIYFNGTARLLSKPDDQASIVKTNSMPILGNAKFVANVELTFDFNNPSLTGKLDMYLNATYIKGGNGGSYVGQIALKFSKDSNYIYVGTPQKPLAILVDVGGILQVKGKLYFDIGKPIPPGAMEIPQWADRLFNTNNVSVFNSKYSGPGVKFGIQIELNANFNWSVVNGHLNILLGGDMEIMRNVDTSGLPISCSNTNSVIGINGWYARGRAYIALEGSLKLKFRKWNVELAGFALGAMLQASGPNPFFATVSGRAEGKVCGFKFSKSFNATVGEQCVTNQQLDVTPDDLITRISPSPNQVDVNVISNIEVDFNLPIGQEFIVYDDNDNEVKLTPQLSSYNLRTSTGIQINLQEKWNETKDKLVLVPDYLPSNEQLTFSITAIIKLIHPLKEVFSKEITFTTGTFNDVSIADLVESSYPAQGIEALHRKSVNKGYVKLSKNMGGLIFNDNVDTDGYKFAVMLERNGLNPVMLSYEYNYATATLEFGLPWPLLNKGEIHRITLAMVKPNESNPVNNPIQETYASADGGLIAYNPDPSVNTAPAPAVQLPTKWKYEIYFRVSQYEHWVDKINKMIEKVDTAHVNSVDGRISVALTNLIEPFFEKELERYEFTTSLPSSTTYKSYFDKFVSFYSKMQSGIYIYPQSWGYQQIRYNKFREKINPVSCRIDEESYNNSSLITSAVNYRNDFVFDYLATIISAVNGPKDHIFSLPTGSQTWYNYNNDKYILDPPNLLWEDANYIKTSPVNLHIEVKGYCNIDRMIND